MTDSTDGIVFSVSGQQDHTQVHKMVKTAHPVSENEGNMPNGRHHMDICGREEIEKRLQPHMFERSMSTSAIEHTNSKDLYRDREEDLKCAKNDTIIRNPCVNVICSQPSVPFYVGDTNSNHIQSHDKTIKSHDMSPDKTAMSLDSLSIVTTDQNDNVNIPQAINSAKPPLPSSSKRSRSSGQGKQSWLLRLFESKLFDMSIAISYLFNSKEPGVQTYLGKY
jgi:hypothetical protein